MFEHIAETPTDFGGNDRHPLKGRTLVGEQELQGLWVDRDDGIDLSPGVFAAQVIGHGTSVAGAAEPGHIEVLCVRLYIEQRIRPEGLTDPLVGQFMGRMPLI